MVSVEEPDVQRAAGETILGALRARVAAAELCDTLTVQIALREHAATWAFLMAAAGMAPSRLRPPPPRLAGHRRRGSCEDVQRRAQKHADF